MCMHCVRADNRARAIRDSLWHLFVEVAGSEERARAYAGPWEVRDDG